MKKLILSGVVAMSAAFAQANETVIARKIVKLPVNLSNAGIRSSNIGYGNLYFVKILVPELAKETILNHRNRGESAPCLATYETKSVESVVQGQPTTEEHEFEVTQKKIVYPDQENKICLVQINEEVRTVVRGFKFIHSVTVDLPNRHIDDCQ